MSKTVSWRLRTATSSDADAGLALLREANLPKEGALDRFPGGYIVAESGGVVIAVAGLERHGVFGLLRSMAVSPEWRRRGIGKVLTERLLDLAGTMGLQAVYLLTTTAQEYFAGQGFAYVEREKVPAEIRTSIEFASACPASAVCMFKKLASRGESAGSVR
jgi:N-acetylglutamate synthase-like GNAT family acetyltransferase